MNIKGFIPGCAALFTFFVFSLGSQYLALLFPKLILPLWLNIFVFLATQESAYFGAYFLNARTPFLVRIVELALWALPLYFLFGGFSTTFLWASLVVFASWSVARGYGAQLVSMEKVADYLGDQAASTISWEYESLAHRGQVRLSTEYFWWRFWLCGLFLAILSIWAPNPKISFLYWGALASGLLLQGLVYLFRLQILWRYARAQVQPDLPRLWLRSLALVVVVLVVLVSIFPVNYSPLTAQRVSMIVTGLMNRFTELPALPMAPPDGGGSPSGGAEQLDLPLQEGELGLMGIVLGLIFLILIATLVLVVLFVVGWALVAFVGGEVEKLRGLPHLAVQVYEALSKAVREFVSWFRNLWARRPRLGNKLQDVGLKGREQEGTGAFLVPSVLERVVGPLQLRSMFRHIVKVGGKKGLVYFSTQTPAEYGQLLGEHLAQDQGEVEEFFRGYHLERYSQTPPDLDEQERLLASGAKIIKQLKKR